MGNFNCKTCFVINRRIILKLLLWVDTTSLFFYIVPTVNVWSLKNGVIPIFRIKNTINRAHMFSCEIHGQNFFGKWKAFFWLPPWRVGLNADAYRSTLKRLRYVVQKHWQGLFTSVECLLHDNVWQHTVEQTTELLEKCGSDNLGNSAPTFLTRHLPTSIYCQKWEF